jgi:ribulose-bisphosphate carboxylase large chain
LNVERIEADYLIETACDPRQAAEIMAGEQSSGTFVPVPGETLELKARAAARIDKLQVVAEAMTPSLPGASRPEQARIVRAQVGLSWPISNMGPSLPNLLATVAGNLFELRALSGLRILDIRLPPAFMQKYRGPQFSITGTRRLAGVMERPLIGTIIKPSVGLGPSETAQLVNTLCAAGIDFIKDDELQADGPACPFEERARAVMAVIERHADRLGHKVMYAFNVTGDLDQMRARHDLVVALGGTCIMASLNSVGLVGMIELARHARLPIHAHRNGWGYLSRHPLLGWSFVAWQKIWRLAGVDHLHVNGLSNKFCEPDESVIASARECIKPLSSSNACLAMPVFSSGQSARQAPATYAALGSTDLIYAAGGGLLAHPDGVAAGVKSLQQAWEAAVTGIELPVYAREHRELARALHAYAA